MLLIAFSILIFAAVVASAYAVHVQLVTEKDPAALRLRKLRTGRPSHLNAVFGEQPPLLLKLIAKLGGFLPARDGRDALRSGLICAGHRSAIAPMVFLGGKVVGATLLPLLWIGFASMTARPLGNVVTYTVLLAVGGFYLPSIYLAVRQRQRRTHLLGALPDALDLLVVCVEAGLGIAAALQRVSSEIRISSRPLSEELGLVHQEIQTGVTRMDAMRNLAQRTGVDEIYSLVAMLVQTDRLGTSVAQALRAHASSMRTRRRQRAEQLARKASIKLAFPLVFLVLPALMIIILGPAAIQLMKALVSGS